MASITSAGSAALPPLPEILDEPLFEIIDGQRVELPPMSAFASVTVSLLVSKLNQFAESKNLGVAVAEVLFRLNLNGGNRRPDGAFVSYQRWPKGKPIPLRDNAWDVVPDLTIEVISPNDLAEELMTKIDEYFRSDVKLVWVIYPATRLVQVYESLTRVGVLTQADELDGGKAVPGFRLPLTVLFQEESTAK